MNPQNPHSSESVTPLKRRAQDEIVYERTGEKRQPHPGELIWHDGLQPAPYPYDPSRDALAMITPIWVVSKDQQYQPPEIKPGPSNEIDRLIQEIGFGLTEDYGRILALGSLHQAKQLEALEFGSREILQALERIAGSLEEFIHNRGDSTPLQTQVSRSGYTVCDMCESGEHAFCKQPDPFEPFLCQCAVCHQHPTVSSYSLNPAAPLGRHRFAGMEGNHFCTECGAGRLHPIHQTA